MATASLISDSLTEHFNTLPMSDTSREELLKCLCDISKSDRDLYEDITNSVKAAQTAKNRSHFKEIISDGIQFASKTNVILQKVLPGNVKTILNVVLPICQLLFQKTEGNQDIAKTCNDGLQQLMDDDMKHECEGIKSEILDSVAYLTGLQPANEMSEGDRIHFLCGLGLNLRVNGPKQLGIIRSKVKDMLKKCSTDKFDVFLKYVKLYCSLTILRELVLLYHFAVLSAYRAPNANCVKNVLDLHKENDTSLFKDIRFLLKPRKETLRMHLYYKAHSCEIIQSFLNRHESIEDPSRFYDKALQIFPEKSRNKTLCLVHSVFGSKLIKCKKITNMENTVFQFRRSSETAGSICSIQPLAWSNQHVTIESGYLSSYLTITDGEPSEEAKWRLVEIESGAPDQPSSFVIVQDSTEDQCIYVGFMGYVNTTRISDNDSGFYWTLNVL